MNERDVLAVEALALKKALGDCDRMGLPCTDVYKDPDAWCCSCRANQTVSHLFAAAKADAWDEGHAIGALDAHDGRLFNEGGTPNPYRAETQPTTPRARECETGDNAEEARNGA